LRNRYAPFPIAAALVAILFATILPVSGNPPSFAPFCIGCGESGATDLVLNLLLFTPLGVGLALAGMHVRPAMGAMVATTVAIEALQLFIPGRDTSLGDVLANALGGALGFLVASHRDHLLRPSRVFERALLVAWSIAWLAVITISAYAMTPSPTRSPYVALIARDLGKNFPDFPGEVLKPRIDTLPIANGELSQEVARTLTFRRRATIRATLVPAACPATTAAILQIADTQKRPIVFMAQRGSDLVLSVRSGANVLRLRAMHYVLARVFGEAGCRAQSESIRVAAAYNGRTMDLHAEFARTSPLVTSLSPTVKDGWRLLTPRQTYLEAGIASQIYGGIWLFCLSLPFGFLGGAIRNGFRIADRAAILMVSTFGLLVIPRLFSIAAPGAAAYIAALAGLLVGAVARRLLVGCSAPSTDAPHP